MYIYIVVVKQKGYYNFLKFNAKFKNSNAKLNNNKTIYFSLIGSIFCLLFLIILISLGCLNLF